MWPFTLLEIFLYQSPRCISSWDVDGLKFMFSKKATKIDEIFTVDLTTYCQIDDKDFVNFCGLLRKRELYPRHRTSWDQKFRDFEA